MNIKKCEICLEDIKIKRINHGRKKYRFVSEDGIWLEKHRIWLCNQCNTKIRHENQIERLRQDIMSE